MANRTVGLRYIAKALGVSTSTVSLALRGSKKISERTRDRVIKEAERLGYRPNAKLNELYRQLRLSRKNELEASLAVVVVGKQHFEIERWNPLYESMKDRASRHGYRVEVFCLDEMELKASRLRTILYFRGIQGIVFINHGRETVSLPEELEEFATVCIGPVEGKVGTRVGLDRFGAMCRSLDRIQKMGYMRPAVCFEDARESEDAIYKSAYFGWCDREFGTPGFISFFSCRDWSETRFMDWFCRYRPDSIIGVRAGEPFRLLRDELKRHQISTPEDVLLTTLEGRLDASDFPGMDEDLESTGIASIDLLLDLFEKGSVETLLARKSQMIEGLWVNEERLVERSTYATLAEEWRVG